METDPHKRKLWMPLAKSSDGTGIIGILSDTSIDRDEEMMSKKLIQKFAQRGNIPILSGHNNDMEKMIGTWTNLKVVEKDGRSALQAEPLFFSKEANPLAEQIRKQVEEGLEMGLGVGVSIGAIVKNSEDVEIDGKKFRSFTDGELLEASFVPVQSNRSSFAAIAKTFGLTEDNMEEKIMVDEIVSKDEDVVEEQPDDVSEESSEEESEEVVEESEDEESEEDDSEEESEEEKSFSEAEMTKIVEKAVTEALRKHIDISKSGLNEPASASDTQIAEHPKMSDFAKALKL